ncbi:MAG: hypothetical protein U1E45_11885 [Geminicoccaceae bacterium]
MTDEKGLTRMKTSHRHRIAAASALLPLLFSACTTPGEYQRTRALAKTGVNPRIDAADAASWSNDQTAYLIAFNGGNGLPPDPSAQWSSIALSGMSYVDLRCNEFFVALDDYADNQRSLRESTGLVGTATATVMGLVQAASAAVAAVGASFTLAQGLMDSSAQTILFAVTPTRLKTLQTKAADAYRAGRFGPESPEIKTRAQAADAIGGYVELCTPVALKSLVGETIDQVRLGARPGDGRVTVEGFNGPAARNLVTPGRAFGSESLLPRSYNSSDPTKPQPPIQIFPGTKGPEKFLDASQIQRIQSYLCVQESDVLGPKTREAIALWQEVEGVPPASRANAGLNERQRDTLLLQSRQQGPCDMALYRNYFERSAYSTPDAVNGLIEQISKKSDELNLGLSIPTNSQTLNDPGVRQLIEAIAKALGQSSGDAVTPALENRLI